jgi:O-methyltransferase domain
MDWNRDSPGALRNRFFRSMGAASLEIATRMSILGRSKESFQGFSGDSRMNCRRAIERRLQVSPSEAARLTGGEGLGQVVGPAQSRAWSFPGRTVEKEESNMRESNSWKPLFEKLFGSWISRAIYVAAKLRIADRLADGPRTAGELAADAGVAPGPLYRVLRALAGVDVFAQEADGRFRLNPSAELLREDGPDSLWALAVMLGEEQDRCWGDVLETVRTGQPAFDRLYGQPLFDYLGEHPEQATIFDVAMTAFSSRETQAIIEAYDLSGVGTLADIGGGVGSKLALILGRYPKMQGLLFDLPHVVERARPLLEAAGVSRRCDVRTGNFFETIPSGADTYVLGHIIHDWDDTKAGIILDNLRRAISPRGRLLVVEYVLPEVGKTSTSSGASFGKLLDLHMMAVLGGIERTETEYRRLFSDHGFRLARVVPTAGDISVIEAVPV